MNKLRQRRTRFIKEYLLDRNATRAAIAAGYSAKTAKVQASRLLTNVDVQREINAANDKINAKLDITVERVRDELAKLAFYDPRKFFNDDGSVKAISELDGDIAAVICGIDVSELFDGNGEERQLAGYIKKIKLADRGLNLERLGRYLQMFVEKKEITHKYADVADQDLNERIKQLERELGLASAIDDAGRAGIAAARESETC